MNANTESEINFTVYLADNKIAEKVVRCEGILTDKAIHGETIGGLGERRCDEDLCYNYRPARLENSSTLDVRRCCQ